MTGTGQEKTLAEKALEWYEAPTPVPVPHPSGRTSELLADLARECIALRAQLAEAQQQLHEFARRLTLAQEDDRLTRASLAATTKALEEYGKHKCGCAANATSGGMFLPGACTCGFSAALSAAGAAPAGEDDGAYASLRRELAAIFGPVKPRDGETWNASMLRRITEHLVRVESGPAHDCAEHTVSGDEGTAFCARCEQEARAADAPAVVCLTPDQAERVRCPECRQEGRRDLLVGACDDQSTCPLGGRAQQETSQ